MKHIDFREGELYVSYEYCSTCSELLVMIIERFSLTYYHALVVKSATYDVGSFILAGQNHPGWKKVSS